MNRQYSKKADQDPNLLLQKNRQRKKALENRRRLTSEERKEKSHVICRRIKELEEIKKVRIIFSYNAVYDEVDLNDLHLFMKDMGKKIAFPISLPHGKMVAAIPLTEDAFEEGAYGIRTPIERESYILSPQEIDMVLVPCLAFDRKGNRLGHGAGYYDRYLKGIREDALTILPAFNAQEMPGLTTEKTDIPIKIIVTESGLIRA